MQQRGNKESHTEKRAETHARGFDRLTPSELFYYINYNMQ